MAWPTVDVLEIGEILHIFPSGTESMGDRRSKKAYTGLTKFGCNRSIVVGCKSRNDRQTSRQTDKQNGMTIRLTLCERDAIISRRQSETEKDVSRLTARCCWHDDPHNTNRCRECLFATVNACYCPRGL